MLFIINLENMNYPTFQAGINLMAEYLQQYKMFSITTDGGIFGRHVERHVVQYAKLESQHALLGGMMETILCWAAWEAYLAAVCSITCSAGYVA
jgi:hypothetical protein